MARAKLGNALFFLGRFDEALVHVQTAGRSLTNYDQVHYDLGSLYLRQNRIADAKEAFERLIWLNPNDYQAYGSLGYVHLKLGDLEQAERFFSKALDLNPEDPIARKNLELVRRAKSIFQK